ncbi:MAG: amidohydrolase family protein, partial [Acidobacteriota bacterium]
MLAFCNALIAAPFASREGRLAPALTVFSLLVFFFCHTLAAQPHPADLVVINATVRTMTPRDSVHQAIAVLGDRIAATGSNRLVKTFIGPSTLVIDAGSRLVLPGFNDAHVHFMGIGNGFSSIDLRDVRSAEEMTARIARYVQFLPKGRWILGGHFDDRGWDLPDRKSLDALAPHNPLFLYRAGAATAIANSLAFNLAKVKDSDAELDVPPTGEATGIVRGASLRRISLAVPANQTTNWLEVAETATNYAASLGVTSVQDMSSDDSREVYLELGRQGKLKTRVYDCLPLRDWRKLKTSRLRYHLGAMVTDGCLKGFSDG